VVTTRALAIGSVLSAVVAVWAHSEIARLQEEETAAIINITKVILTITAALRETLANRQLSGIILSEPSK
jgi:hypothetical protein